MKLSQHFYLREFTLSQTATRLNIDMTVPNDVLDNLTILCVNYLEVLRRELDTPIIISSGFRPLELNRAIGGSDTSAHMTGSAADMRAIGVSPIALCRTIRDMDFEYDQNIHEFGRWTHLGIQNGWRRQDLTAYKKDETTLYVPGIHRIKDLI